MTPPFTQARPQRPPRTETRAAPMLFVSFGEPQILGLKTRENARRSLKGRSPLLLLLRYHEARRNIRLILLCLRQLLARVRATQRALLTR